MTAAASRGGSLAAWDGEAADEDIGPHDLPAGRMGLGTPLPRQRRDENQGLLPALAVRSVERLCAGVVHHLDVNGVVVQCQ